MKQPRNIVKRGQFWKNRQTGKLVRVMCKWSGNRHWTLDNEHHIHEGTLTKYYDLV